MNPFSFFSKKSLSVLWTYSPQGSVWRIIFGGRDRIVGEARDRDKKTATFFCVDSTTGRPLWENRAMKEPWWVGIEAVHRDIVLVHGFEQPDMPGHRGIDAWSLETGEELWRNEDLTYWFCYGEKVYGYRTLFERRVGYALDLRSGKVLETFEGGIEDLFTIRQLAVREAREDLLLFPQLLREGQLPTEIRLLIERETKNKEVTGEVEYLLVNPFIVLNYHVPARNSSPESLKLENHLAIIDVKEGTRVFEETIAREASAPVPDSFFVREGLLFFVKDQRILQALELPGLKSGESS